MKDGVLPGPIKLHTKAATVWERAKDDKYESDRAIAWFPRAPWRRPRKMRAVTWLLPPRRAVRPGSCRHRLCPGQEQTEAAHG